MITRMTVRNFRALRDVTVDLAPFTVLIGPNDTGKTSFLEAIYAIAESTRTELTSSFWSPWQNRELVHNQTPGGQVQLAVVLAGSQQTTDGHPNRQEHLAYSLTLSFSPGHGCSVIAEQIGPGSLEVTEGLSGSEGSNRTTVYALKSGGARFASRFEPHLQDVAKFLPPAALARWDVEELAMPSRLPPNRRYPFDPSGYGLATCIAEMKLGRRAYFDALRDDFCRRFPPFGDIVIDRTTVVSVERDGQFQKYHGPQGEGYGLVLLRNDGMGVPAALVSGGALVTLAFLTLLHLPEPRKLLLIEEPENGLHPIRLKEVVDVLRQTVSTQNDCQVILTTHSPLLLDYVRPEEVRVFLRNDREEIEVHNLANVPDIQDRLKYLMLGELVYNEGEQELVKEIQEHARSHSG